MISRIRFPTKFNNSKKLFPVISIYYGKTNAESSTYNVLWVLTRHLNTECFDLAVPANFVSYAPTFFLKFGGGQFLKYFSRPKH